MTTLSSSATWTQQSRFLWTGRRDDHPIGTIERGHRYVLTDVVGRTSHHRSLQAAQAAADD